MTEEELSDKDQEFIKHCENVVIPGVEVSGNEIFEMYKRLSLFWIAQHIDENTVPTNNIIPDNYDPDDHNMIELFAGTLGPAIIDSISKLEKITLNKLKKEEVIDNINQVMGAATHIRNAAVKNDWTAKFDAPYFNGTYDTPFQIIDYLANLLNIDNIGLIRPYDVRVIIQLTCKKLWELSPPYTLIAMNHEMEMRMVHGFAHTLEEYGHPISLTTLRREAETYVKQHFKKEPHSPQTSWEKFKNSLKKKKIPPEMLQ